MTRRHLELEEKHWGFPCAAGTEIDTFERAGTLARDVVYRSVTLPVGSSFRFDCDFDYLSVRLAAPVVVHGIEVPSGSTLEFQPVPAHIASVVWFWLLPLFIFPLVRSLGARMRCEVTVVPSGPVQAGELDVRAQDRLTVDKRRVRDWLLSSPRTCRGLELSTGHITFDGEGRAREVLLYRSQTIQGFPCLGSGLQGTELQFDENGRIERLVLSESHRIAGRTYAGGTPLTLESDGRVFADEPIDVDVAVYTTRPEVHGVARGADDESPPTRH